MYGARTQARLSGYDRFSRCQCCERKHKPQRRTRKAAINRRDRGREPAARALYFQRISVSRDFNAKTPARRNSRLGVVSAQTILDDRCPFRKRRQTNRPVRHALRRRRSYDTPCLPWQNTRVHTRLNFYNKRMLLFSSVASSQFCNVAWVCLFIKFIVALNSFRYHPCKNLGGYIPQTGNKLL